MRPKARLRARVDEDGRLITPSETARRYGLSPEAESYPDERPDFLAVHRGAMHLAKVYIEPTNRCNLGCRTCIRHSWDEPLGHMTGETFGRTVEGLRLFDLPPAVFFGGLGEPLMHPDIVDMVAVAKTFSSSVELITNGTLLSAAMSERLIDAGLDMLWVSLDGATPESYADVRLGAALPKVLENLSAFHVIRLSRNMSRDCRSREGYAIYEKPYIGIVFVAMKRNIDDLPALLALSGRFAVSRFMVTNILPYTAEMCPETLYSKTLTDTAPLFHLELPRMDVNEITVKPLAEAARSGHGLSVGGASPWEAVNRCPFIHAGATTVSWVGNVSPCLPLLHSHSRFVNERRHSCRRHVVGNVNESSLNDLWHQPDYVAFRERVQRFEFSPCTVCGGCDLSENNETDCLGNPFPTCGTCPWAQGIVQCP